MANELQMRIEVKAYVLYETWLAQYCAEHNYETPSEEVKKEAKKICRNLAKNLIIDPNFLETD